MDSGNERKLDLFRPLLRRRQRRLRQQRRLQLLVGPYVGFFCCIRGFFLRRIGPCLILDAFDAKPRVQPPGTSIMMRMSVLIGHRDMSDRITLRVCIQVTEVMYAPREIMCGICRHSAFFDCSLVIYRMHHFTILWQW